MIKVVLFDVNGVLVNGEMFSDRYAAEYNVSKDKLLPFFNGPMQDCVLGKADLKESVTPYLSEWKWEKSPEELLEYWLKAEHNIDEPLVEYVQFLQDKGVKCYIATNQEKYRTQYIMKEMGFGDIFDGIFSSSAIGAKKPEESFYMHIINQLELKPEELLLVDDDKENIDGAKELGMHAQLYTDFSFFKKNMEQYLDKEQVDIVDTDMRIIGKTSKLEAHHKGLLHKCVVAEVVDTHGRMMLVKPFSHRQDAGQYVSPVGGHISAGEDEIDALKREVKEEIGIETFTYKRLGQGIFDRHVVGRHENHYFIVYEIHTNETPQLGDEAESYKWFTIEELRKRLHVAPHEFGDAFYAVVKIINPGLLL